MEIKTLPLELKAYNDNNGSFTGYISIKGNIDNGGDRVLAGAFTDIKTTPDGYLRITAYHDLERMVGKAKVMEDERGYFVEGNLNLNISYVKDIYEQMKSGLLDAMSFGFSINNGGSRIVKENGQSIRELTSLTVYEGAIVAFGMNPAALLTGVKSIESIRDYEKKLKSIGLSNEQAKTIASKSWCYIENWNKNKTPSVKLEEESGVMPNSNAGQKLAEQKASEMLVNGLKQVLTSIENKNGTNK